MFLEETDTLEIHELFITLMREKQLPTDILKMLETGIDLALFPPRPYQYDDLTEATDILEDARALATLNDISI